MKYSVGIIFTVFFTFFAISSCKCEKSSEATDTTEKKTTDKLSETEHNTSLKKTENPVTSSDMTLFLMHAEKINDIFNSYEKKLPENHLPSHYRKLKKRARKEAADYLSPQGVNVSMYFRQSGRIIALFIAMKIQKDNEFLEKEKKKLAKMFSGIEYDKNIRKKESELKKFSEKTLKTSTENERELIENNWESIRSVLIESSVL